MVQVQLMNVETPTQNPFGNGNKIHGSDRIGMLFGCDVLIVSFVIVGERERREPSLFSHNQS